MEFDNDSLFDQKERKRKIEPNQHHRCSSYRSTFTGRHLKTRVLLDSKADKTKEGRKPTISTAHSSLEDSQRTPEYYILTGSEKSSNKLTVRKSVN